MKSSLPLSPQVMGVVLSVMEGLRCPRAVTVAIMLRHGMWKDLVNLDLHPSDYNDSVSYGRAAYATGFLKKMSRNISGVDPREAALVTWHAAEKQCALTNIRLNNLADFGGEHPDDLRLLEFLDEMKRQVAFLIGGAPPQVVDGHFGPGATISDKAGRTTVAHKLSSIPTLTTDALYHLVPWTGTKWAQISAQRGQSPFFVRGNHYFQVPKTAKTNRSCAKEASINAFYQRGFGLVMSKRLADSGFKISRKQNPYLTRLGLNDHAESYASNAHVEAAKAASIDDRFATIDLSSASDTISTALVRLVLPHKWHETLYSLRSPYTKIGKKWYKLEKFSSMGNGYTFELETTIFAACCLAIDPCLQPGVDLFVFGDDIIVPKTHARAVIAALRFLGLTTNKDKTFVEGPFKESCGGDFYGGQAVRPYYLKESPNEPQDWIAVANGIRRLGNQNSVDDRLMGDLRRAWFQCLDCIPSHIRMARGPVELGDLVIHDDSKYWQRRERLQKHYIKIYRPIRPSTVLFARFDDDVRLTALVYGMKLLPSYVTKGDRDRKREIPMRGPVSGYKLSWASYG